MVKWTAEQTEAIEASGSDILVAAAAGSGKTTVLVERIIQRILSGERSIDEMMVATFTNASARDMKDKIEHELNEAYARTKKPGLYQEMINLKEAHISTLHSFCLYLIRMHYNAIGVSPDMRTLGEVEMKIRLDFVINNTLEKYYKSDDRSFDELNMMLASDKSNEGMVSTIRSLYHTAIATPDPSGFLEAYRDQYIEDARHAGIFDDFNRMLKDKLYALDKELHALLKMYYSVTHEGIKETEVRDAFDELSDIISRVKRAIDDAGWGRGVELPGLTLKDGRHSFFKKIADDGERDALKTVHDRVKTQYNAIATMPDYTLDKVAEELSPLNDMNNVLIDVTADVINTYKRQKFDRNEMDFSDYEHYALDILNANDGELKEMYQAQFKEVMIDEYQDINRVQEAIITSLKRGGEANGNLFMVGDVKQSIYKFRQADPSLFIEKSKRFVQDGSGRMINLNHNFRSHGEVLSLTNALFERMMDEEVGEIIYDDNHRLVQGNYLNEAPLDQEVHVIEEAEALGDNAEIRHIINEVKALKKAGVNYSDIIILTRNTRDNDAYRKLLNEADVPVFLNNRSGYLDTLEIRTMLSILSIIDNPLQDDHLVGTLRLPMFGFTEETLSQIRAASGAIHFHEAMMDYPYDDGVSVQIDDFQVTLEELVGKSRYLSVPELIDDIFYEFNLLEYFSGLPGGVTRRANLNGLVEKAVEFESMSHVSLYEFITYITRMIDDGQDFGEENTVSEDDDILRVMTIHASKGLEFDYVIYAGLHRQLNRHDLSNRVIIHPDQGLAFKRYLPEYQTVMPSVHTLVASNVIEKEMISEEMRLVYVAMTRAVNKLIMPFVFKEEYKPKYSYSGGMVLTDNRLNIKSIQELILPVLMHLNESGHAGVTVRHITQLEEEVKPRHHHHTLDDIENVSLELSNDIADKLHYQYPYHKETEVVHKESVTEIKRRNEAPPDDSQVVNHTRKVQLKQPNFMNEGVDAPVFGTMMHEIMMHVVNMWETVSLMDDDKQHNYIRALVNDKMADEAFITNAHIDRMHRNIEAFLADRTMTGLLDAANNIHTEIPFIMNQRAIGYSAYDAQIVQGIIDCLMEIDGSFAIIDYKTDRVAGTTLTEHDLFDRYYTQMDIYKRSVEKALGKDVKVYLYFFDYGAIEVD